MLRNLFNRLFGRQDSDAAAGAGIQATRVSETPIVEWPPQFASPEQSPAEHSPPEYSAPERSEVEDWIRGQIERDVAAGFLTRDEILQSATDCFADELPEEEIVAFAASIIDEVIAQHRADQANWPETTDCDRLDAAFRSLEAKGIVARQNFSCCGNCGSSEIWDEVGKAKREGRHARGYAFFHMQDTENAVEGRGLYLNYGASEDGEEAWVGVGHEIQQELENHGLSTNWDGTLGMRIGVSLEWKRRSLPA